MRRARGFTLIELLVAISILAMVAVLGWRGLDGIVRARVALTEQMEVTRGMQLAFAQMQSDCEHMADSGQLDKRPFLLSDNDRMTLVRTVFVENEPMRLQVVAYRVVNGTLTRRESIGTRDLVQLDVLWTAATSDADPTAPVTLQAGVTGMLIQTWENNGWRQGPQANAQQLLAVAPTGLQVALQVRGVEAPMVKAFLLGGI
jgi:general secretion pathway protein J